MSEFTDFEFLQATDEDSLIHSLSFARSSDSEWILHTHNWALDVIGDVREPTGSYDTDSQEIFASVGGYHANIKCDSATNALIPANIKIPNPNHTNRRIFFGDS